MDLFDGLPFPKSEEEEASPKNQQVETKPASSVETLDCESKQEPRASVKRKSDMLSELQKGKIVLKGYSAEMQGERDAMEDRFCLVDTISDSRIRKNRDISTASFYGVFDGHNGRRASNFVAESFLDSFLSTFVARGGANAADVDAAVSGSLMATYKAIDAAFLSKCSKQKPPWKDGTTATTVLILNNEKAFIANVGDSEGLLCRYDNGQKQHKPVMLTIVHSPAVYEERLRIQQQGGHVKDHRLNGVLEVSRSLGDLPYKKGSGLISTPAIRKCCLTPDDKFIVLACDGLWKALTPTEVIDLVLKQTENSNEEDVDGRFSMACTALAREALKRLTGDNVTVLLIRINIEKNS